MALKVLVVGGTGQISLPIVEKLAAEGHRVSVVNRGVSEIPLPKGVVSVVGDMSGPGTYEALGTETYDVVCQFRLYTADQMERDIAAFTGRTGQYVFISSASAYQKPVKHYVITERTPLENPYWQYSRDKIACEAMLRAQTRLPYTIVRPSHTIRTGLPFPIGDGDAVARRILRGAPVIVHGDGLSLWTLTRAVDFAAPFVRLLGNPRALGEDFQITNDRAYTWDQITRAIGAGLGAEPKIVHVPSDTLIAYNKAWEGPLLGDKSWSVLFDNAKVKAVAGHFACEPDVARIVADSVANFKTRNARAAEMPHELDPLMDRICAAQAALGG